ncbi:MAG TPA: hypothetical protein ENI76_05565 [Ignavibacteria bacterium]|nr:hypothetical protein [Ignavibacteria bacterium]
MNTANSQAHSPSNFWMSRFMWFGVGLSVVSSALVLGILYIIVPNHIPSDTLFIALLLAQLLAGPFIFGVIALYYFHLINGIALLSKKSFLWLAGVTSSLLIAMLGSFFIYGFITWGRSAWGGGSNSLEFGIAGFILGFVIIRSFSVFIPKMRGEDIWTILAITTLIPFFAIGSSVVFGQAVLALILFFSQTLLLVVLGNILYKETKRVSGGSRTSS